MDSTGVAGVKKGHYSYYKDAVSGSEFVSSLGFENWLLEQTKCRAMMGHNRAATMGAANVDGAHPFTEGDIVLTHNGTLRNWRTLPDSLDYDVDSQLITYMVSEYGIEETVEELKGAWALAYADIGKNTMNFCCNKERPLHFARLRSRYGKKKALNVWMYGSEKGMMKWIIERNGYEAVNFF